MKPPAIIVVGHVVSLRDELNWFEKRPLFGKRIVVTRAREQASGFLGELTRLGAECVEFPTIEVEPPASWDDLDQSINALEDYHWLLFTSVNGVKYFLKRLEALGKDVSKRQAEDSVNAVLGSIATGVKSGKVQIIGFGTFEVKHRAARMGRNPATGATISIAATTVAAFKSAKGLKDRVAV